MLFSWISKLKELKSKNEIRIILASASPRRREILTSLFLDNSSLFEVETSGFEETLPKSNFKSGGEYALATARGKAIDVAKRTIIDTDTKTCFIIGADTVLDFESRILEKPTNSDHAKSMLKELSGKIHLVSTGLVIIEKTKMSMEEKCNFITTTKVKFQNLSDEAIEEYVNTKEPMDKSGAYGIQGFGRGLVEYIEGDFYNVVGFPCSDFSKHFSELLESNYGVAHKKIKGES